jgi:fumarate reductase subunit D
MADAETGAEPESPQRDESRSVLVGSFRRAFADTDSRLLKSYVVVSALLGGVLTLLLLLALPVWIFNTAGGSELATFSRAFLVVGGVLLLVALVAPVVSAGRRHARGTASERADASLALAGYLFVLSLYVSLLISAPPDQREAPPAVLAPAVEFLYSLPATYAVAPPLLGAALVALVHRFAR